MTYEAHNKSLNNLLLQAAKGDMKTADDVVAAKAGIVQEAVA